MQSQRFYRLFCLITILFTFVLFPVIGHTTGIRDTKHNLSGSKSKWPGQYSVKAVDEPQICIFCHTPHNANPAHPLWNHEVTAVQTYHTYWSNTLQSYSSSDSQAWPVDGYSKLCLSCHDGTVAVGSVSSRYDEILMVIVPGVIDNSGKLIGGAGYLGTDLRGGHPISIIFDANLVSKRNNAVPKLSDLNWPIVDKDVKLYPTKGRQGVQCTSCHDPHTTKGGTDDPPFWRKPTYNEVCAVCHRQIPPDNIDW